MPPLPPPNTLAQLEEACRRLEEVSKPQKQRYAQIIRLASIPEPGMSRRRSSAVGKKVFRNDFMHKIINFHGI